MNSVTIIFKIKHEDLLYRSFLVIHCIFTRFMLRSYQEGQAQEPHTSSPPYLVTEIFSVISEWLELCVGI